MSKKQRSSPKSGPAYVDVLDPTRTVVPFGTVRSGRVSCRVFFDVSAGRQEYAGQTVLPVKLFDDRTMDEHKLSHSQHVGFLLKVEEKK
jgi:hypothetical protein